MAISSVCMVERKLKPEDKAKSQVPIYFISRTLKGPEERYLPMEKLVLALVYTSRRLRRYFQDHPVRVMTDQPLQGILRKPELSGRMAKWAVELAAHTIDFIPRTAVKGQVLADFLAEVPEEDSREVLVSGEGNVCSVWELHMDGASGSYGQGAGVSLKSPEGIVLPYAIRLEFEGTNNTAEYEALIAGLKIAQEMKAERIKAYVDSLLIVNQYRGEYDTHNQILAAYLKRVKELMGGFKEATLEHVPRSDNTRADALSKLASTAFEQLTRDVKIEVLTAPSIQAPETMTVEAKGESWMTNIRNYLLKGEVPEDKAEAWKLRNKAFHYEMIEGELYRRSYLNPSLKCVDPEEANYIIREIHEGICGMHAGPRSIVAKAMNAGFYWPGMHLDALEEIRKCDNCQIHAPLGRLPKHTLVPVNTSWPFQQWAMDIVGPFPPGGGRVKFLVVAIDYFTKWVEAKPLATITGENIKRFAFENIVCHFGIPRIIVSDNGTQFANDPFKKWCADLRIEQAFTSVAHPQANGLVERANRSIVEGIKARLGRKKQGWLEELPHVLWSHRTSPKTSNGETPFSLTYGTEAMIPVEIGSASLRTRSVPEEVNSSDLRLNLDLLEERREQAAIREVQYKKKMEKYYNSKVKELKLLPGDLVLRENEASGQEDKGKLGPRWEGPYRVTWADRKGSFKIAHLDGTEIPRTWNLMQLRKYYQ